MIEFQYSIVLDFIVSKMYFLLISEIKLHMKKYHKLIENIFEQFIRWFVLNFMATQSFINTGTLRCLVDFRRIDFTCLTIKGYFLQYPATFFICQIYFVCLLRFLLYMIYNNSYMIFSLFCFHFFICIFL